MSGRGKVLKSGRARRYRCRQCQNAYPHRQGLWRHIKEMHGPLMFRYCRRCSYKACRKETLRRHYASRHPEFEDEAMVIREELERHEDTPSTARLVAAGWLPETVSTPPVEAESRKTEEVVISLSPTPISPLQRPVSPDTLAAPRPPGSYGRGKPRGMLSLLDPAPVVTSSDSSSMPSLQLVRPPPVQQNSQGTQTEPAGRRVLAVVREQTIRVFLHEGVELRREQFSRSYRELVNIP
ncbi:uncharacterized protein [Asterias amurensis]|uniref:uncharacterized protein n=1 Tax=Asterias amurensis TaxID=7602 RepID=UPI003AB624F5